MSPRKPARILEVTSYPPPRAGWGVRVEFLKKRLMAEGHQCVVLNTGTSRLIPSTEYETVRGGSDFLQKVMRYSRQGFTVHAHANGDSVKGLLLALTAEVINALFGRRSILTFHAGAIQRYFPLDRCRQLAPLFWLLFALPRRIICNNQAVRERIQRYGISGKKIVAIPAFSRQYLRYTPAVLSDELERFFGRYPHVVFSYLRMRPLFYPVTMIDGMARLAKARPEVGLVICGGLSHSEAELWQNVQSRIREHRLEDRICFIDDLDHDSFLTALQRSALYLRTPVTDGVASSVMESLALGIPVVASENGTRPAGVVTYPPSDSTALAAAVDDVIMRRDEVVATMSHSEVPDTLADEVDLLTA